MTETPAAKRPVGFFWYLRGRAGRAEYWVWIALLFALGFALSSIPAFESAPSGLTFVLMAMQIRRVHDFGRTGWWAALATIAPVIVMPALMAVASLDVALAVGLLVEFVTIIWIGAIRGDAEENRFGPPPTFTWRRVLTGR